MAWTSTTTPAHLVCEALGPAAVIPHAAAVLSSQALQPPLPGLQGQGDLLRRWLQGITVGDQRLVLMVGLDTVGLDMVGLLNSWLIKVDDWVVVNWSFVCLLYGLLIVGFYVWFKLLMNGWGTATLMVQWWFIQGKQRLVAAGCAAGVVMKSVAGH